MSLTINLTYTTGYEAINDCLNNLPLVKMIGGWCALKKFIKDNNIPFTNSDVIVDNKFNDMRIIKNYIYGGVTLSLLSKEIYDQTVWSIIDNYIMVDGKVDLTNFYNNIKLEYIKVYLAKNPNIKTKDDKYLLLEVLANIHINYEHICEYVLKNSSNIEVFNDFTFDKKRWDIKRRLVINDLLRKHYKKDFISHDILVKKLSNLKLLFEITWHDIKSLVKLIRNYQDIVKTIKYDHNSKIIVDYILNKEIIDSNILTCYYEFCNGLVYQEFLDYSITYFYKFKDLFNMGIKLDLNKKYNTGSTLIQFVIQQCYFDIAELLVEQGAKLYDDDGSLMKGHKDFTVYDFIKVDVGNNRDIPYDERKRQLDEFLAKHPPPTTPTLPTPKVESKHISYPHYDYCTQLIEKSNNTESRAMYKVLMHTIKGMITRAISDGYEPPYYNEDLELDVE